MEERLNWDEFFMAQAFVAAQRSPCKSRKVGAVLVRDKRVIAEGYNGPPSGYPHCETCIRKEKKIEVGKGMAELCPAVHAEENCITQLAYMGGTSAKDSTIYVVTAPCKFCLSTLINAGVEKVIYYQDYKSDLTEKLLEHTEIKVAKYSGRPIEEVFVGPVLLAMGKTFDEDLEQRILKYFRRIKKE